MITQALLKVVKSRGGQLVLTLFVGMFLGAALYEHYDNSTPNVTLQVANGVPQVTLSTPTLNERVVTKFIESPTQAATIKRALADNQGLQATIDSLISAQAHVDGPTDLTVVTTTGKDVNGKFIGTVKLFENTASGGLKEIKLTNPIAVFADERTPSFHAGLRIQGGFTLPRGGIAAVQWLRHGKSNAAEDSRWALFSPAVGFNETGVELTILPVSFNLGTIPHIPLTNLWVSPTFNLNKKVGVALTATF